MITNIKNKFHTKSLPHNVINIKSVRKSKIFNENKKKHNLKFKNKEMYFGISNKSFSIWYS